MFNRSTMAPLLPPALRSSSERMCSRVCSEDSAEARYSTMKILLSAARSDMGSWLSPLRAELPPSDLSTAPPSSPRMEAAAAALRRLLRCVVSPAAKHSVCKVLCEHRRSAETLYAASEPDEAAHAALELHRSRLIRELADRRKELASSLDDIRACQALAEEKTRKREDLMQSCDRARRQLVHLQGYRCKIKRAARVIRGAASQFELHSSHEWPISSKGEGDAANGTDDAAVADCIRQHMAQLVRRSFTAEGALVDESIRFLRSSDVTLKQMTQTMVGLLADSGEGLTARRPAEQSGMPDAEDGSDDALEARQPMATRKMRALLTLAHGQHISAFEEVEVLRIQAHEARARAEEMAAEVEKKLTQVVMSDSDWRITSISMKQDRDHAAAHASLRVVKNRLNDMKIKVQMDKGVVDRLEGQRCRLRALSENIRHARASAAGLAAEARRVIKLVYERNADMTHFCETQIVGSSPGLQETAEGARAALMEHTLEQSLAAYSASGRWGVLQASRGAEWGMLAHTLALALDVPTSSADHRMLELFAAALWAEERAAAYVAFGWAQREGVRRRAAASAWNSATTIANTRTCLDNWDAVCVLRHPPSSPSCPALPSRPMSGPPPPPQCV